MCREVWEAIDMASGAGLPTAMIVGFIEMAKLELLAEVLESYEDEPA